ncbi:hypothetical protein KLEB273_gp141 [Bacillus phage vB_BauM_KLEB27-3]|nr:hypothetical protein KLEB273_gp141 [Bacillus phage vB_BauM_KLEB27-3]
MIMTEFLQRLIIGDSRGGGHGKFREFYFASNLTDKQIQNAYKETCKKIQMQMHDSNLLIDKKFKDDYWRFLVSEFEDSIIKEEAVSLLKQYGFEFEDRVIVGDENIVILDAEETFRLFMWFVKHSEPTFEYEMIQLNAYDINGKDSSMQYDIGYGSV